MIRLPSGRQGLGETVPPTSIGAALEIAPEQVPAQLPKRFFISSSNNSAAGEKS